MCETPNAAHACTQPRLELPRSMVTIMVARLGQAGTYLALTKMAHKMLSLQHPGYVVTCANQIWLLRRPKLRGIGCHMAPRHFSRGIVQRDVEFSFPHSRNIRIHMLLFLAAGRVFQCFRQGSERIHHSVGDTTCYVHSLSTSSRKNTKQRTNTIIHNSIGFLSIFSILGIEIVVRLPREYAKRFTFINHL